MNIFNREDLHAPNAEINTTPLVDVMLVLMVIFLITAPVLEKSTNVNLPKEGGMQVHDATNNIVLSITAQGRYYIGQNEIPVENLEKEMMTIKQQNAQNSVSIKADAQARHENVMKALGVASKLGFATVNFVTLER